MIFNTRAFIANICVFDKGNLYFDMIRLFKTYGAVTTLDLIQTNGFVRELNLWYKLSCNGSYL